MIHLWRTAVPLLIGLVLALGIVWLLGEGTVAMVVGIPVAGALGGFGSWFVFRSYV